MRMSKCFKCHFWKQTGEEMYQGKCTLSSISCITAVFNGKPPTRFLKKEDVVLVELKLEQGKRIAKGRTIFMTDDDLVEALRNKQRITPTYPGGAELTDESKKMLRKRKPGRPKYS